MVIKWFIAFVILVIIELVTINLVTIWFALGAVAAMIATIFTDSLVFQLIVFLIVSFLSLLITKPLLKRFKKFDVEPTNVDRVIGQKGEVIKRVGADKSDCGEVKVLGNVWTAYGKEMMDVGCSVKVLSIDGVKLIVEKEEK